MKLFKTKLLFLLQIVFLVVAYPQNTLQGLISYWNMNESGGSILHDAISGSTAVCNFELLPDIDGINGNSQYFDFKDKAIISNNDIYDFPANSSFTITYWMKFTETQYGLNGGQDHIIISKGDWQTGGPYGALWASGVNGSGKVNFLLSDNTGYKIDLEGPGHYNDGLWHFVACVRDEATDGSYLYADGEVVDYADYDYTGSFTNTDNICIAHLMNQSNPEYYYMGAIDEVCIYNRALSYNEINTLKSVKNGTSSINQTNDFNIEIYPVPAKSTLNIKCDNRFKDSIVEIVNTQGNICKRLDMQGNELIVDLDEFSDGIYILRAHNGRIQTTYRFIIIK